MSSIKKESLNTAASTSRQSTRLSGQQGVRVIDELMQKRRLQRQLAKLEQDNFQEDPHANLVWNKAVPKFADGVVYGSGGSKVQRKREQSKSGENATKKGKKLVAELTKTRFRKTFVQLLEESEKRIKEEDPDARTYADIIAKPSALPPRKFCSVCGLISKYTCVQCHSRYCSIRCLHVHTDTRCLKWTA